MVIKSHILRTCSPLARCLKSWHSLLPGNIACKQAGGFSKLRIRNPWLICVRCLQGVLQDASRHQYFTLMYEKVKIRRKNTMVSCKAVKPCIKGYHSRNIISSHCCNQSESTLKGEFIISTAWVFPLIHWWNYMKILTTEKTKKQGESNLTGPQWPHSMESEFNPWSVNLPG